MVFYDANLSFGLNVNVQEQPYLPCKTIGDLQAALKRAGVKGGLVRSEAADMSGPVTGNQLLSDALESTSAELFGMYTIVPSYTHEIPSPTELPEVMKKGRFGVLRLSPKSHRFLAKPQVLGDYLEMACERKIPVVFDTACGITLSEIYDIMDSFPKLTAILANYDVWPTERFERPFLSRFENLRLELSSNIVSFGIEALVKEYGSTRLLYGSKFPERYMGGMMLMLRHAEISEEDKQMIAGDNLISMITEAKYE